MDGSLKEIHLGGLIRLLTLHRFTGGLHLEGSGQEGVLYIRDGLIQGAVRAPNPDPIGQRLVRMGLLKGPDLEEALQRQKKDPARKPLGAYLVASGPKIPPDMFRIALEKQTRDNVAELLKLSSGTFRFEDGETGFSDFPVSAGTEDLILRSFRDIPTAQAAESLPPGSAILEWAPRPSGSGLELSLTPAEWNTLLLFDGSRNLDEVLRMAPEGPDRPPITVHGLLSAGLVKKVRFRFPDLERIAQSDLGNMGLVLVQNAYQKTGVSRARMGMRELVRILNDLEKSMTLIVGPTRAGEIAERMWESTKR
jgi:hypothetical protein